MPTTTKPLIAPDWTSGQPTQIAQPTPSLQASGFTPGQRPTAQHLNFLLYNLGQWVSYLDQTANGAVSSLEIGQSMRLTGGGVWYYAASANTLGWSEPFALSTPSIPDAQNTVAAGTVPIQPGQVAYVVANLPFATMAATTTGSTSLTNVQYEVGIAAGQTVTGNGIPSGTTVVSISGTTVTLSNAATATASNVVVTFVASSTLMVQVANIANLQPAPNVIIIATVTPMYAIVGVNSGQMRLYDGEQKRLLNSGFIHSYVTQAGSTLSFGQVVYISPGGSTDADAFQATMTSGSPTLSAVSSTANIMPGSVIAGTGIPQGTTVTAVGTNSLSLSANATSSGSNVSLQSQRIAGAAYAADASRSFGFVRGNVAGLVTATPSISQTAASAVRYMTGGTLAGFNNLSPGALYYVDPNQPGALTTTTPSQAFYAAPVAVATSTTALYVQPLVMARPATADSTFNDIILGPISGASNQVGLRIVNAQQSTVGLFDNSGNITSAGTLNVAGQTILQGALSTFAGIVVNSGNVTSPSFVSASGFKSIVGNGTLSNVTLAANTGTPTTLLDASGQAYTYVATHAGSIVGISGYNQGSASVQGGSAGAQYFVTKNGSAFINGPSSGFGAGPANVAYAKGTYTFLPGDYIQMQARAPGTSTVLNAYVHASFAVELGA